MAMKTTHRTRHKKQAWSESHRGSYRKLKWGNSSEEVRAENCEIGRPTQRIGRPNTSIPSDHGLGHTRMTGAFRWANCAADITRLSPRVIQTTLNHSPRGTSSLALTRSVLFPPIKGSRMSPGGEVVCSSTHLSQSHPVKSEEPKAKLKTRVSTSNLNKENTLFRLYRGRRSETLINNTDLIHSRLAVTKLQDSIKHLTSRAQVFGRSVSANEKLIAAQPSDASIPATLHLSGKRLELVVGGPSANDCRVTRGTDDGATGRSEPKQINDPSTEASDTETQSLCPEGKDGSEVISEKLLTEEEYYDYQRIAEWVLKVNASLFTPPSESTMTISHGEEQDTAIKIVYEGD